MTILLGTDFSQGAEAALRAAAAWAKSTHQDVVCVHAVDVPDLAWAAAAEAPMAIGQWYETQREHAQVRLALMAQQIQRDGVLARTEVLSGHPDVQVAERAKALAVSSIVVAATGHRGLAAWRLGSTADRIAQKAEVPVLVVRDPEPLEQWAEGEPLRMMVALEDDEASDAALHLALQMRRSASVELVLAHVWWPPEHGEGAGLGVTSDVKLRAAIEAKVETGLRTRLSAMGLTDEDYTLRLVPGFGKPAEHLSQLATENKVGVLLLGSHRRKGLARLWHGSVSRDALVACSTNAMVVPH
jgi:nucleotide-binding universal stress UspA family protein